jgi:hypothetical protein
MFSNRKTVLPATLSCACIALALITVSNCKSRAESVEGKCEYVLVQSAETAADQSWQEVAAALRSKHADLNPRSLTYSEDVAAVLDELSAIHPRYTCFLAPHGEVGKEFVAAVHELSRALDDDPYTDTRWGILTGYDSANALRIAQADKPLVVEKVLSGTEIAMDRVVEGYWYSELQAKLYVEKKSGGEAREMEGASDSTKALVDAINEYQPDLIVTSGHATPADWQIGYSYRNGVFKSNAGKMWGVDLENGIHKLGSDNPKVYLPIGNCLMGDIPSADAMALAWMNSVGVHQMIGYTVPTWFGYAGWGMLDYFLEQPGRYSMNEAFIANQQALMHALKSAAGNKNGLEFDKSVLAFYGDPAWEARMAPGKLNYEQSLAIEGELYSFTITPRMGEQSFAPVNTNGSQRGWRPIIQFLPERIGEVELLAGDDLNPVITDDFILVPNPRECDPEREYKLVFRAKPVD